MNAYDEALKNYVPGGPMAPPRKFSVIVAVTDEFYRHLKREGGVSSLADLASLYLETTDLAPFRVTSKWDIRRDMYFVRIDSVTPHPGLWEIAEGQEAIQKTIPNMSLDKARKILGK